MIPKLFSKIASERNYLEYFEEFENPKGTPLDYTGWEEYYVDPEENGHWLFRFPNEYGASVIKRYGSYGYKEDKFELAVIFWSYNDDDDKDEEDMYYDLTFSTPITDDVIGHLTNEEVLELLEKIKKLEV